MFPMAFVRAGSVTDSRPCRSNTPVAIFFISMMNSAIIGSATLDFPTPWYWDFCSSAIRLLTSFIWPSV